MMERTKKTLMDEFEHYGLSGLAQTWPDTATAQSQYDRQVCARSGTCLHHAMLVCWEQVKDVHRAYASATPSRTFQGIEK
ncbi:TPA: hypothetical protein ACIAIE_004872 [Serratia fonticola]